VCATHLQTAVVELPFHSLRAIGLKPGVTESCWLWSPSNASQACVKIVNTGGGRDAMVKFLVGPRARLIEGGWDQLTEDRIKAAAAKNPSPSIDLEPTTWEQQHKDRMRMSYLTLASEVLSPAAPMPMFPPPALHVNDVWPGIESDSGSEVEVVAINGPTLMTRGFFEKANLKAYLSAVDGHCGWWDIQEIAATNDLTTLLLQIGMKTASDLKTFMHYLNMYFPLHHEQRFHRLARCTGPLDASSSGSSSDPPPTPPGFKSAFMIGKFKGKKLKKAQAAALVRDDTLGFDKPVLTRASAAKSLSTRALVSRVKAEIKLW
jgi:hypothetical protein